MSSIGTKRLTFDEWQALPETKQRCEVVDGVLSMPPSPLWEHQWISSQILIHVGNHFMARDQGIVLSAPYDILIQRKPLRTRQPDILVVNDELTGIAHPSDPVGRPFLERPPLLVIEVISPSNTPHELEARLADYRSIGVPECWLASLSSRSVEVLRLTAEAATSIATFGMGDTLESDILPGFSLPIADLFGPLLR